MKPVKKGQAPPSAAKHLLGLIAFGFLSGNFPLVAQESQDPSPASESSPIITGALNTGESLAGLPSRTKKNDSPGTRTRFQPVAPPSLAPAATTTPTPAAQALPDALPKPQSHLFLFPVEAIRHPNDLFLVKIHHKAQVHSFWSNIDWGNLEVIPGIQDHNTSFHFLLFVRKVDPERPDDERQPVDQPGPAVLPPLIEKGPLFTPAAEMKAPKIPAEVLNFLEATHQVYHAREADLLAATRKLRTNRALYHARQREAAGQAPQPAEEVVIRFWHGEPKPLPPHLHPKARKETDQ